MLISVNPATLVLSPTVRRKTRNNHQLIEGIFRGCAKRSSMRVSIIFFMVLASIVPLKCFASVSRFCLLVLVIQLALSSGRGSPQENSVKWFAENSQTLARMRLTAFLFRKQAIHNSGRSARRQHQRCRRSWILSSERRKLSISSREAPSNKNSKSFATGDAAVVPRAPPRHTIVKL